MVRLALRTRLKLRDLMIAVALIGLLLGGSALSIIKARDHYREAMLMATQHRMAFAQWSSILDTSKTVAAPVTVTRIPITGLMKQHLESDGYDTSQPYFYQFYLGYNPHDAQKLPPDPHFEDLMAVCRERVSYHSRMWRKWLRVAYTPWVRLESDPPRPPVGEPAVSQSY